MSQNKTKNLYVKSLLILCSLSFGFLGCEHLNKSHNHKVQSEAHGDVVIESRSGNKTVKGQIHFMYQNEILNMTAKIEGLKPNSTHGFHIHEVGDCTALDATTAGGHFSPNTGNKHSSHTDPNRHAGDLGNIKSDKNGVAEISLTLPGLNLSSSDKTYSVLGRAIIVHADPDDMVTQPTGNSGARIGCGVIK